MKPQAPVIPQPPQVRPPGPSHDGFAANDSIMTPDKVASIQERQYPKMMYCDGEEPLRVETPEVEETLGSGWRETPEDPNRAPDPLTVPTTREAYYKLNQLDVLAVIAQTTDEAALRRMWTSEVANPRRPNGRPIVLEALTAALTPTEPAVPAETETPAPHPPPASTAAADRGPEGPPVPAADAVDESELEPLPQAAPTQEKTTRGGKKSK